MFMGGVWLAAQGFAWALSCGQINAQIQQTLATVYPPAALARVGLAVRLVDPRAGVVRCAWGHREDAEIYPASTIKTLIGAALLERVQNSQATLNDSVTIDQPNAALECSDWGCTAYGPGQRQTLGRLLEDMLTVSNNLATNQLIDFLGKPALNEFAVRMGAPDIRIQRKVYSHQNPEPGVKARNRATARALAAVYTELATGARGPLAPAGRAMLNEILLRQTQNDRLSARWPAGTPFAHKPGNTSAVVHDAGLLPLPDGNVLVIVALQDFVSFPRDGQEVTGQASLAELGEALYRIFQ